MLGAVVGFVGSRLFRSIDELRSRVDFIEDRQVIAERLMFDSEVYKGPDKPIVYRDRIGDVERRVRRLEETGESVGDYIRK